MKKIEKHMMKYKDYIAKVEYDDENKVFSGEVINTRTVITFHGTSVMELEKEFRASINDYLEWCKEDGIEPERPYSGHFNVRLNPELHRSISIAAKEYGMSLNAFMEKAAEDELESLSM